MTKRAFGKFKKKKQDSYDTPLEAVRPLINHLPKNFSYVEPCAGEHKLVDNISQLSKGKCLLASDIEPRDNRVKKDNALGINKFNSDYIITNPPWTRKILHPLLDHFINSGTPTWILLDADWAHTKQAKPFGYFCKKIVSVGRVSWEQNNISGFDNCAWYLFDWHNFKQTEYYWRTN